MSDPLAIAELGLSAAAIFAAIREAASTLVRTPQYTSKVISNYGGEFVRSTGPGLSFKKPYPLEQVAYTADLTLQLIDFEVNIKTKNDNFIDLPIQIHYEIADAIKSARLPEIHKRKQVMQTLAGNVIRGHFAEGDLQNVYTSRNEMAELVRKELQTNMEAYGLTIRDVVVENPKLPSDLQASMQAVTIADRTLETSKKQSEAIKIKAVATAEGEQAVLIAQANGKKAQLLAQAEGEGAILVAKADAEKKARTAYGEGVANEQIAIAKGFHQSIEEMKSSGITPTEAMSYIQSTNNRQLEKQIAESYADAYGKIKHAVLFADTPNHAVSGSDRVAGGEGVPKAFDIKELAKLVVSLQNVTTVTNVPVALEKAQPA